MMPEGSRLKEFAQVTDALPTQTIASLPPNQWFAAFTRWLTGSQSMLRSFSLLRIVLGSAMFLLLITSAWDRHYMWGIGSRWTDAAADLRGFPEFFNVFPKNNPAVFDALYVLLIALTVVFILGAFTRFVTPMLFLLWVGLSTNAVVLSNAGDVVTRIMLFFVLFANLTHYWSIDAFLRKRREAAGRVEPPPIVPRFITNAAHNTVLIILMWQLILIYVNSGIFKLRGSEWREGTAVYYALNLDQFMPFPVLSEIAWKITPFVFIGTLIGLWVQLLFPILLLNKATRYLAILALMGMHLGIGFFFGLWPFSMAMLALDLLFIRDSSWEKMWALVQRFRARRRVEQE